MHIEKKRLSKGLSYPLRASALEAVLAGSAIAADAHLIQSSGGKLFECFFWPPNPNVPHERLYIRTAAVPEVSANEARLFVEKSDIPEFTAWLKASHSTQVRKHIFTT